mmetsp:Transcript_6656/g.20106  ORF Transcript_6656/g.20106 Transcript_6656/m.20106 type:complete len:207 (-) Transcript_6656:563-1183(-)
MGSRSTSQFMQLQRKDVNVPAMDSPSCCNLILEARTPSDAHPRGWDIAGFKMPSQSRCAPLLHVLQHGGYSLRLRQLVPRSRILEKTGWDKPLKKRAMTWGRPHTYARCHTLTSMRSSSQRRFRRKSAFAPSQEPSSLLPLCPLDPTRDEKKRICPIATTTSPSSAQLHSPRDGVVRMPRLPMPPWPMALLPGLMGPWPRRNSSGR